MHVVHTPAEAAALAPRVVFAAGFFDGIHRGHQEILEEARRFAAERGAAAWVLTFDPHPLAVLAPSRAPAALSTTDERLAAFEAAGMDGCLLVSFTRELAAEEPDAFADSFFAPWKSAPPSTLRPPLFVGLVSGPNWTFGNRGAGTPSLLATHGVDIRTAPFVDFGGAPVSSSRIREAIVAGRMEDARAMLGHPYRRLVTTDPRPERGVGSAIGAPTANISAPLGGPALPCGVYALDATLPDGAAYRAVANYGWRPTFPDARPDAPVLEVHLLDFPAQQLYGVELNLDFLAFLRPEQTFATPAELAAQIQRDIAAAKKFAL